MFARLCGSRSDAVNTNTLRTLEVELQRKLQNSRIERRLNSSERRRAQVRGKGRVASHCARRRNSAGEVGVIEDIERVDTRLQAITLPHLKDPAQGDIEIHVPGTPQTIA